MQSACPHMVLAHDHGSAFGNAGVKSCDVRRRHSRSRPSACRLQNLWKSCGGAVAPRRRTRPDPQVMPSDILGRFPEPKTPGVRHARSAGMRAADTGRSVTPRDRAAARPPTPTAVRSVAGTTSVNASASGRPLRFRLIGRTGVSACGVVSRPVCGSSSQTA